MCQRGHGFKVHIQVTDKHSMLSETAHILVMLASLCIADIHNSKWHLGIYQTQQIDTAGLITWIALIYANTLKS